jgi:NADPH-dependent glutamate synthase beta subunit-like oxidoreductase
LLDGVYAAGADLIVLAISAGRQAARAMDEYLRGLPAKPEKS